MGYISCRAESSISTANSHASTSTSSSSNKILDHSDNEKQKQKPIKIQEFNYKDLQLATNNFSSTKLLGRGSHGLVYKGVLRCGRLVAIKKPSRTAQKLSISENPNEIDNEISILSNLQSPYLVNLVGFTKNDSRDRLLVVEFMSNGTLYDVLHSNPRPPNWVRRIKLALQIAKAIDMLHRLSPPVIHRDIKSANILIDKNFNARLGDFGLALRCVDDYMLRSTPPAGTMGYLDPCYVTPDDLSTKNDVFSFGILLLEIISGRKAIDVGYSPPSIVDWAVPLIRRGKLLSIYDPRIVAPTDALVRKMFALLPAKCVRSCKERRPSMKEVVECLNELSKLVKVDSWNGFRNPCLMVENVGRPIQSKSVKVNSTNLDSKNGNLEEKVRSPRREYSDLGFKSNLMDLMSGPDLESKFSVENDKLEQKMVSRRRVLSFRLESGRFIGKTNVRSIVLANGKDKVFFPKKNDKKH
ncbi:hypothetical protein BUALT_Bualt19G0044700 [Buddleja alternifolia]|uniref:Protein kinase domain-containing protein n=1 Tax=Buddleja alternifolia TaxID=168488 RepID=A0AAV6W1Q7_9LAMI|nr:hypothetical protein BUALT_Bualt19G0044700 [Buddleja alternifolia]